MAKAMRDRCARTAEKRKRGYIIVEGQWESRKGAKLTGATLKSLAVGWKSGDEAAQAEAYNRLQGYVATCVRNAGVPEQDVGEVCGDVWAQAWAKRDNVHPERSFKGWLAAIARHRAFESMRLRARRPDCVTVPDMATYADAWAEYVDPDDGEGSIQDRQYHGT